MKNEPIRCERCGVPEPFTALWCVFANRGCKKTELRVPTEEMREEYKMDEKVPHGN